MKALTSINPPSSGLILDEIKTIEWRTKPLPLGWHELYETKKKGGLGKVTGRFEVVERIKFNLHGDTYRPQWIKKGCVPYEFLLNYAKGKDYIYANVIGRVERYDKPKKLNEFTPVCKYKGERCEICCFNEEAFGGCCRVVTRPPQSWCYIDN